MRAVIICICLLVSCTSTPLFADEPIQVFTQSIKTTDGRSGTYVLTFDPADGLVTYNIQLNDGTNQGNIGEYARKADAFVVKWWLPAGFEQSQLKNLNADELEYRVMRDETNPLRNGLQLQLKRQPVPKEQAQRLKNMGKTMKEMRNLQQLMGRVQETQQLQHEFRMEMHNRSKQFAKNLGHIVIE